MAVKAGGEGALVPVRKRRVADAGETLERCRALGVDTNAYFAADLGDGTERRR